MFYKLLRYLLFHLEPETAHHVTLSGLRMLCCHPVVKLLCKENLALPHTAMGIQFPNPVGLAAGLDKNADYLVALSMLGFGFIEVGTVTPKPQPGNPKPRLFRLVEAEALINRMGFNSGGLDYLVDKVQHSAYQGILGINIGKNADTPLEAAVNDYILGMRAVYQYADYIAVNLSSPNTQGLRNLQYGAQCDELLNALKEEQATLSRLYEKYVPLVVKIAPDLNKEQLHEFSASLLKYQIDGVIATNTTVARPQVSGMSYADQTGGLSGKPLFEQSTIIVTALRSLLGKSFPIIGVGGIMSGNDAAAKIQAGADLVQIYTGLIYHGPHLVKEIIHTLKKI